MWTIKIYCRRFFSRLSTNVMTLLLIQKGYSETNIFLSTKVIWEREKRGLISYLSAWGSDRRLCLKYCPAGKTIYIYEKWQRKEGCTRRFTKALPFPVGRDRKIRTAKRTNQIAGSLTVPFEIKINNTISVWFSVWYGSANFSEKWINELVNKWV